MTTTKTEREWLEGGTEREWLECSWHGRIPSAACVECDSIAFLAQDTKTVAGLPGWIVVNGYGKTISPVFMDYAKAEAWRRSLLNRQ